MLSLASCCSIQGWHNTVILQLSMGRHHVTSRHVTSRHVTSHIILMGIISRQFHFYFIDVSHLILLTTTAYILDFNVYFHYYVIKLIKIIIFMQPPLCKVYLYFMDNNVIDIMIYYP